MWCSGVPGEELVAEGSMRDESCAAERPTGWSAVGGELRDTRQAGLLIPGTACVAARFRAHPPS